MKLKKERQILARKLFVEEKALVGISDDDVAFASIALDAKEAGVETDIKVPLWVGVWPEILRREGLASQNFMRIRHLYQALKALPRIKGWMEYNGIDVKDTTIKICRSARSFGMCTVVMLRDGDFSIHRTYGPNTPALYLNRAFYRKLAMKRDTNIPWVWMDLRWPNYEKMCASDLQIPPMIFCSKYRSHEDLKCLRVKVPITELAPVQKAPKPGVFIGI